MSTTFTFVSVLETVLYFVLPVVGVYLLIAAWVVAPRRGRQQRYRVGQPWPYEPLFWTANPEGARLPAAVEHVVSGERGGARGKW